MEEICIMATISSNSYVCGYSHIAEFTKTSCSCFQMNRIVHIVNPKAIITEFNNYIIVGFSQL